MVSTATSGSRPRLDWGEALDVPGFYGREQELATLERWVVQERCHVVSVLGIGGVGKSALSVTLMRQVAEHFQIVLWRSLRDAPGCSELLADCVRVISPQALSDLPASLEGRLERLLEQLQKQRVLLLLDNLESLLEVGEAKGRLRPGYEGYSRLLQEVAQRPHQSCLLLTSREKPAVLRMLEGRQSPVRSLRLGGLEVQASEQILATHALQGSPEERGRLIEFYEGHPLALHIVAETIVDLFAGEIAPFLAQETLVFGSISQLLDEQWSRLSALEQTLLAWLAVVREPVSIEDLQRLLVARQAPMHMLEAIDALGRRSLVERGQRAGTFTLQSVVLEYATTRLVEELAHEIEGGRLELMVEQGLELATAKDYVRQTQTRLLVAPLLALLRHRYQGRAELEQRLLALLDQVRKRAEEAQGYGPANLLALLREERGHLRGLDLSQLSLRAVSLQGVDMQDASLSGARLEKCVFTETFDAVFAVAISRSGQYWATGGRRGEVRLWRENGQTLNLVWQAHTDIVGSITFSPDERTLASGSFDGSLKLWEVETGTLLWSGWHSRPSIYLAFAPDGGLLVSGGHDACLRLWAPKLGTPLQEVPHPDAVFALAWRPDGRWLATGDGAGTIRLWEIALEGGHPSICVETLRGHSSWVRGLAFSPDGSRLASGSWDGTVKLWEVGEAGSLRERQTLLGHTDKVHYIAWSADGATLASCSFDSTIRLWDVKLGRTRMMLSGHSAVVYSLAFTPDSRYLLSGSEDGTLRLWEVERGQCACFAGLLPRAA